ncbi:MAG: DNA adenine methylase [Vicinamibacterales bacterium]
MHVAAASAPEAPRPPLKWAGGKRWQVPYLRSLWAPHAHRRLVEPFCGGLAVSLGLRPDSALLNDANPHVINFYRWLKLGLRISIAMENDEAVFYRHRARFNALVRAGKADSKEAAGLFYYLNRTAFNGLCRFNRRGEFNVPFGQHRTIPYRSAFSEFPDALARYEFVSGDFEDLALKSTDFVYADPPYDVEFTAYARGGFSWEDQVRTATVFTRHRGPVVLVNQFTSRVGSLYRSLGYDVRLLDAPRRISCTGNRMPAQEILATRNL